MRGRGTTSSVSNPGKGKRKLTGKVDYSALGRDLVDGVESGVYIVQSSRFVYVNPFFAKLTGYSPEELTGTRSLKLVLPQDRQAVRKKATRNLKSHTDSKPYEYRLIKKNGEIMWAMERISSIEYMGQKAALGSFMDITGRKRLEDALAYSERTYRTILEQMYDSYYEVDLAGNFTFVNDAVCRNLGYSNEEMLGQSYRFTTPSEDIKPLLLAFNEVFRTGIPNTGFAHGILRKDGSTILVESSISLRENEQGEIIGFRSVSRDITERKRVESALRDSEEQLRASMENAPDGIFMFDLEGNFLYGNHRCEEIVGYQREELIGKNFLKLNLLAENSVARAAELLQMSREGKTTSTDDLVLIRKDGRPVPVEIHTSLIGRGGRTVVLAFIRDITERKRVEEALEREKRFTENLIDTAQTIVLVLDTSGHVVTFNSYMEQVSGYKLEDVKGKDWFSTFLPQAKQGKTRDLFIRAASGIQTKGNTDEIVTKNGETRTIEWFDKTLKDAKGNVIGLLSTGQDITDRKNAEHALHESEEKYRALVENVNDVLYTLDTQGNITYVSPVVEHLTGYKVSDLVGKPFVPLIYPDDLPGVLDSFKRLVSGQLEPWEFRVLDKDGKVIFVRTSSRPLYKNGEIVGVTALMTDITERKRLEEKLKEMATHDFLTGLPNRVLLLDRFAVAAALARRNKARLAVMSLDLDKFKSINDTLGHDAGDQVLKTISTRLAGTIRASDTLARVGGDEFVLVMLETNHMADTTTIAQKILDSFIEPLVIDGHRLTLSTSIGAAIYPDDGEDLETLTKKSDAAMYYSKGHGRNQFKFFADGDVRIGGDYKSAPD